MRTNHQWEPHAPYCSCGQDTVTCQGCGRLVCGDVALRVSDPDDARMSRNVGPCCWARFGLGHAGPAQEAIQNALSDKECPDDDGNDPEVTASIEAHEEHLASLYTPEERGEPTTIDLVAILKERLL